jgi:hypothetical protein
MNQIISSNTRATPGSSRRAIGWVLPLLLVAMAPASHAASVVFTLSDLHFSGPAGQNGWPLAVDVVEPGAVGHFRWTYADGNFQNGAATLLDISLPITSLTLSDVSTTTDLTGITGTYPGNVHNLTYDFKIVFANALSSPGDTASVDASASTFDFTGSYAGGSPLSEWTGNIVGGTISASVPAVPEPSTALLTAAGAALALLRVHRRRTSRSDPTLR